MKKMMMKSTARVIIVAAMMIAFAFAFLAPTTAMADEEAIGTVERVAEVREEALAEKATSFTAGEATVEPVVEGATGATEVTEVQTVEEILAEIEAKNQVSAPAVEEKEIVSEAAVVEEAEEVIFEEGTTAEEIEDEIVDDEARVASTSNAPATNNTVTTISSAEATLATDTVEATYAETAAPKTSNVAATDLQIVGGKKVQFTVIGRSTLQKDAGQSLIDAGNIVCYPSTDMTKGVKWFAGHNPGAMSNMNTIKVGSVVRLSNSTGYQDYKIVEKSKPIQAGSSMASISFSKSKSGSNMWDMISRGTENAVIIQFCINGTPTFFYGQAI